MSINKFFEKLAGDELGKIAPPGKVRAIDIFRPPEMKAALKPYHSHIEAFRAWLIKQEFNENLRELINADFKSHDNIIEIGNVKIAVEVNGCCAALMQALKQGRANFGIMVAPWNAEESEMAVGKLPVVRMAVIRQLDILKYMEKQRQLGLNAIISFSIF